MKSPFPGMDPYLEPHWRDVHASLIIYARDALQERLPAGLRCRVEERVVLETPAGEGRSMYPDIRVMEKASGNGPAVPSVGGSGVITAEPLILDAPEEEVTETFLEIVDVATGNKVITVIEVLSPTNKTPGETRAKYVQKRKEVRQAGVSLVEIDLLRQGRRFDTVPLNGLPPEHLTHYLIVVRRGWRPSKLEVYRAPLRTTLPSIRVPLRQTDADAALDLQALIDKCYRNGRYEDLDYSLPLDPPLEEHDAAWLDEVLKQAGKR
jgi:hypothetical protein